MAMSPCQPRGRLPAEKLNKVKTEHIWWAVQRLIDGYTDHPFKDPKKYHVIAHDGSRWPSKAVFGVAATKALGCEVQTYHFASNKSIRRRIEKAGFKVVRIGEVLQANQIRRGPDDLRWIEGHPQIKTHRRRERSARLARLKKAQFRKDNEGRLFCEKCGVDPTNVYGEAGVACIEVHHTIPLAEMEEGHETTLEELRCLCANCHRAEHYKRG